MKAYVQYYNVKLNGLVGEALASDGYRLLDARLSLRKMIERAEEPNFQGYTDYEIRLGDFKRYTVIYKSGGILI